MLASSYPSVSWLTDIVERAFTEELLNSNTTISQPRYLKTAGDQIRSTRVP